MQLTWKASESASALHAAQVAAAGWPLAPPGLAAALAPALDGMPQTLLAERQRMLALLVEQAAAGIEQNHQLAERVLTRLAGRGAATDAAVSELAAWTSAIEHQYYQWHRERGQQQLVDEIVTRTPPLRDQWEARGPGMLRHVVRITEEWVVAPAATVVMVLPAVGGYGTAHLPVNLVTFEAVLANPHERLPEVVRLAWLLAQLQMDLPAVAEQVPAGSLAEVARLALLPAVLTAAEVVELARYSVADIEYALTAWGVASTPRAAKLAPLVDDWWRVYQAGDNRWVVAVAALAELASKARR